VSWLGGERRVGGGGDVRERRGEGGDGVAVGRGEEGRRRQREGLRGGEGGDGVWEGRGWGQRDSRERDEDNPNNIVHWI
jgi:hypothetical protein